MKTYGWSGRILRADLTNKKILTEPTIKYAKRFIGGRGINQWILFRETPLNINSFDPENRIIYGVGPLVGTAAPCSCRFSIATKNVLTGGTTYSNCGGHFAPELKFAGFDNVVIYGKAQKPLYLWINNCDVELKDASPIWGKTTWETDKMIKEDLNDQRVRVSCIGPAGENLVSEACVISDRGRVAGGGGVGAVMGSKKLKAIAVRGTKPIEVSKPEEFMEIVDDAWSKIEKSEITSKIYHEFGTLGKTMIKGQRCPVPIRNAQDNSWETEKTDAIWEAARKYKRKLACFNCPIACSKFYEIKDGPYGDIKCEGFQGNHLLSMMRLDIDGIKPLMRFLSLCNQLGLDTDNSSVVLSWAFEAYQRGALTKADTDGMELKWGDEETTMRLLEKLAYREGVGDLLAEGVKKASQKVGKGSEYYAIHIKGQDSLDGERGRIGWALGIVTSTRGGRHLDGAPNQDGRISEEMGEKYFGVPTAGNRKAYDGQAKLVTWFEQYKAVVDMLGICYFTSYWAGDIGLLSPEDYARLLSTATGIDITSEELMRIGRSVHEIEKAFNTLHAGFTRKDDFPPRRYMDEPIKSGPYKGERIEEEKWSRMLDEYYELHRWDRETGWQKREGLEKLGLGSVIDKLEKAGKVQDNGA